eukprot:3939840-Rhodomonas_salina.1
MILREVWARLMRDGDSGIRFGPKDKDFFPPLPEISKTSFNRNTIDNSCVDNEGRVNLTITGGIQIVVMVQNKRDFVFRPDALDDDSFDRRPNALVFQFKIYEEYLMDTLDHIITAKAIAKGTGLPEDYCRKLRWHTVD